MKKQSLAEFGRSIGLSPATARQWKKRDKIIETVTGWVLVESVTEKRDSVTVEARSVTLNTEGVTVGVTPEPESVTEKRDSVTVGASCSDCALKATEIETLNREVGEAEAKYVRVQKQLDCVAAENDSLKLALAYAQNEVLGLRAQIVSDSVEDAEVTDAPQRSHYTWREFVDLCCQTGKRITGEEANRLGIEEMLKRRLKIQPDALGFVPSEKLAVFEGAVNRAHYGF